MSSSIGLQNYYLGFRIFMAFWYPDQSSRIVPTILLEASAQVTKSVELLGEKSKVANYVLLPLMLCQELCRKTHNIMLAADIDLERGLML